MYPTLVDGLFLGARAALSACVGRLAFLMRVYLRGENLCVNGKHIQHSLQREKFQELLSNRTRI